MSVIKDKTKVIARVIAHLGCPFCNGEITCIEEEDSGSPGIMHSMPTCKVFEDNDPIEFLRAVRLEIAPETFS